MFVFINAERGTVHIFDTKETIIPLTDLAAITAKLTGVKVTYVTSVMEVAGEQVIASIAALSGQMMDSNQLYVKPNGQFDIPELGISFAHSYDIKPMSIFPSNAFEMPVLKKLKDDGTLKIITVHEREKLMEKFRKVEENNKKSDSAVLLDTSNKSVKSQLKQGKIVLGDDTEIDAETIEIDASGREEGLDGTEAVNVLKDIGIKI